MKFASYFAAVILWAGSVYAETVCSTRQFKVMSTNATFSRHRCIYQNTQGASQVTAKNLTCTPYFSSGSNFAKASGSAIIPGTDYSCTFNACFGERVRVSTCGEAGGSCSGDTYLRLTPAANHETTITANDDHCGLCSSIDYTFSAANGWAEGCYDIAVAQGCIDNTACGGTVRVQTLPAYNPCSTPVTCTMRANVADYCYLPDISGGTMTVSACSEDGVDCNGITTSLYSMGPDISGNYQGYGSRTPATTDNCGSNPSCERNLYNINSPQALGRYFLLNLNYGLDPSLTATFKVTYNCLQ